ncbi:helix-turn-helix domain-containing protein [Halobiforma nitratireducens]|uniref:Bacterio-opsin activator HTH domain protein n=1 Tax=Halobiforma nitratireducens JCM 10879 TaxID=1227454 RepID=M0M2L8_9EURY|nr:helix-turn-helix domain-containing protein [Halobiforma nitratireducens]EMA40037.1 Bacterio-opsin activator HTH domain protein [Halobiforma nitratireducens JCM 10879]
MSLEGELSSVRLTLDLWHPNCWAIEATDRTGGGVLAHAVYNSPTTGGTGGEVGDSNKSRNRGDTDDSNTVKGLFTAFGDTSGEVENVLDAIRASEHSGEVFELQERFGRARNAPGNVVREFFLEYDPTEMVCPTLLENGFVHSAPVRIEDGSEEWNLCFAGDRSAIEESLDDVREQTGAEVTVTSITTSETPDRSTREQRLDTLTTAQREVFEHAREAGYYEWPREVTTRELADDLDLAKSTLLEHLRRAESKLLDP